MFQTSRSQNHRRVAALALTAAVHIALVRAYLGTRTVQYDPGDTGERIQWLLPPEPTVETKPISGTKPVPRTPGAPRRDRPPPVAAQPQREEPVVAAEQPGTAAPVPAPDRPGLLQQAKRAVGKIDRELRAENRNRFIRAPVSTARKRLEKGFEAAYDMAPNAWYQAPKVKEIIDPGGYGRRRYRVVSGNGTYCVTYESNHAPDGIDSMQHGLKPKLTNCPVHEQEATKQEWQAGIAP